MRISWPSAIAASTVHDFTGSPSICTTHAPQFEVSQPQWVPVSPGVSRMKWTSNSAGSISLVIGSPLIEIVTCINPPVLEPARSPAAAPAW